MNTLRNAQRAIFTVQIVNNKTVTITLDWLSFTFKRSSREEKAWFSQYTNSETATPTTPRHGYSGASTEENGILHMWNLEREEMGHHVVVSGSCLRDIIEYRGISQQTLLQEVINAGASITRLDLAKDAKDVYVDYDHIWSDLERGNYKGSAQKTARMQGGDGGDTIYIGSRTSDRFMRLYDKAAQTGNADILWSRLEIEYKGMVARAVSALLAQDVHWSSVFNNEVSRMLSLPEQSTFGVFVNSDDCAIGVPKIEKQVDREKWIDQQVIKAVCQHYVEHPDSDAVKRLIEALNFLRDMDSNK